MSMKPRAPLHSTPLSDGEHVSAPFHSLPASPVAKSPSNLHVLIIGGGVTGLTTAWELLDRGYRVTVVAAQYASAEKRITSQIAGALWEWPPAVCGKHTDEISLANSKRWCMVAYNRFAKMAADPATGVQMRVANFFFGQSIDSSAMQTNKMREIEANVPGFRHDAGIIDELGISPDYGVVDCYQHLAPVIDTDQYMQWLYAMLSKRDGLTLTTGRVSGDLLYQEASLLQQYKADLIVNATGLDAKELAGDDSVYPLRGALVRIINDGSRFPRITQAMSVSLDGREGANDMVFIVPRSDNVLILGGLAEPHETDINLTLDNYAPLRQMYERNLDFFPALRKAEIDPEYSVAVGLRPFRQTNVRVERETRVPHSRIIHSYGQGGAGFSLSFGCAQDVADLADDITTEVDHERLPPVVSLLLILLANFLFNVSFYIIVPTATQYARSLGSSDVYSGLVIGGVTLTSAVTLIPLNNVATFRDFYRPPLALAVGALAVGHMLYAIAGFCDSLALLLVGRLVNGLGFTGWLFVKRYCTDPRIVGLRRRTMCTNLLVSAQTLGMVCGPLFGSLLARLESHSSLFNGNTYPAHIMALVWLCYGLAVHLAFQEVPSRSEDDIKEIKQTSVIRTLTRANWITTIVMSLTAFTVFFVLGAWESNIPIVGEQQWNWDDGNSGIFIAAGGLVSFALILPVTWQAKRFQDRLILLVGLSLALVGALVHTLGPLTRLDYGAAWVLVCWGMNLSSTITLSLTSKTLPDILSDKAAITIQLSNYSGRLLGAIWGTAGETVGAKWIARLDLLLTVLSFLGLGAFWRLFKSHTG